MARLKVSPAAHRALLVVTAAALWWGPDTSGAQEPVSRIVRVLDGRTLVVKMDREKVVVRLLGVEAPSRTALFTRHLLSGRRVKIEAEPGSADRDEKGRFLRNIYLDDGTLLNAELVRRGYATPDTELPCSHAEEFLALDRHARERGLGLYTGTVPPLVPAPGQRFADIGLHMPGEDGVGMPNLIPSSRVQPAYPETARREGAQGRVVLQIVVRRDGTVGDIFVLSSPARGSGFEEAAVAAVSRWRYKPALKDGQPVDVLNKVLIDFAQSAGPMR